jgi:leucyl/phenylalanyl-tRNA---protein transferase
VKSDRDSKFPIVLDERLEFPDPRRAPRRLDGLLAVGGDLSPQRLLLAYRSGIFPWSANPITWWSPDPRAVLDLERLHVSSSLQKTLKRCVWQGASEPSSGRILFEVTANRAFGEVVKNCASAREEGNWITPELVRAYVRLHEAGQAHSVECWEGGRMAGGIYGVAVGGLFAGESMFHRASNASKVALWFLVSRLRRNGFCLFDLQMLTPLTERLGGRWIPREEYLERLAAAVAKRVVF